MQHQRQQKRRSADGNAQGQAAKHRCTKGAVAQDRQVNQRLGPVTAVARVLPQQHGAHQGRHPRHWLGHHGPACGFECAQQQTQTQGQQGEPAEVKRHGVNRRRVVTDKCQRECDGQQPKRDVDQENPVPTGIGDDGSAKQGAYHTADDRRHGKPDHGLDHTLRRHGAQQDEATHRHHHGATQALQDAKQHQFGQAVSHAAQG